MKRAAFALAVSALLLGTACEDDDSVVPPGPIPSCSELADHLHTVAVARPGGRTFDAALSGGIVLLANGADGIVLADFATSAEAVVVATVPSLDDARALDVAGSLLFVANGADGLAIVDIGNPAAPVTLGTVPMPGAAVDVDVVGSLVFVANDAVGMFIIDASDPASPVIRGIENTPGEAVGVAASASESLAFVADRTLGVRIVNVADPDAPFLIRAVAVPGTATAVAYEDGVVAVAAELAGLALITPVPGGGVAGQLDTPASAVGVAMSDNVVFVADATGGVRVVDVSDPFRPRLVNATGVAQYAQDVAFASGYLAIADDQAGARVMVAGTPSEPPLDAPGAITDARGVAAYGDFAIVADAAYGLWVVDTVSRSVAGSLPIADTPLDVFLEDSLAYVNTVGSGVFVVDLQDPSAPADLGAIPSTFGADAIAVGDPFIYLLSSGGSVTELRIDGSGIPRVFNAPGSYYPSIAIDESFVYLADVSGYVSILDRATMDLVAALPVGGSAQRVVVQTTPGPRPETRVVVALNGFANGQPAIETWDFTTLFDPQLVSSVACGINAMDVAIGGSWMVVAGEDDGCEIFDLGAAGGPVPIGGIAGPSLRAAAFAATVAVAAGTRGLLMVSPTGCLN